MSLLENPYTTGLKNLTREVKKQATSLSHFMQKTYWKIVTIKPSLLLIAVTVTAASIFLLGGGVYDILEQPAFAIFIQGRIYPVYPYSLSEQFLGESVFVMILYGLGTAGLLVTYQSTKYAYRPRQAFMFLLMGLLLIVIAYIFVEYAFVARWNYPTSS
jgi:predicted neutral ceramidase superfamily lipid hydrolase